MGAWIAWATDPIWSGRFEVLLQVAKDLRDNDHPEAAIVTAQTACEVCTEILLTETFRKRGIDYLSDPLGSLLPNYNLGNDRVRRVYQAATNDLITTETVRWAAFKQHTKKRNDVVHAGEAAARDKADASIKVVEDIIRHMVRHHYEKWS